MNSINDFNANCVIASSDVASAGCLNKGVSALKSQQLEILERDAQQSYGVVKHNVSVGDWNISACGIQAHNTEYFPGDEVTYNDLTYVAKVSIAPNATTTSPADDSSKWTSDFGNCTKSTQFKDLTLSGNLTVKGTTTTLDVETLSVEDANITIGTGANATVGSGITVGDDSKHLISYAGADTACLKNVTATSITTNDNGSLTVHGSGSFTSGTGDVTLNGDVTIDSGKTFSSGTGDVTLNGDVTIDSGKSLTMSGPSTFTSGTGDVTLNGDVTIDSDKSLTMSGTSTFTSGTGAVTLKGDVTIDDKSLNTGNGNITTSGTISAGTFNGTFNGSIITSTVTLNNSSTNYIQVGSGTFAKLDGGIYTSGEACIGSSGKIGTYLNVGSTADTTTNGYICASASIRATGTIRTQDTLYVTRTADENHSYLCHVDTGTINGTHRLRVNNNATDRYNIFETCANSNSLSQVASKVASDPLDNCAYIYAKSSSGVSNEFYVKSSLSYSSKDIYVGGTTAGCDLIKTGTTNTCLNALVGAETSKSSIGIYHAWDANIGVETLFGFLEAIFEEIPEGHMLTGGEQTSAGDLRGFNICTKPIKQDYVA